MNTFLSILIIVSVLVQLRNIVVYTSFKRVLEKLSTITGQISLVNLEDFEKKLM
jgi:hypothetical protein